MIGCLEALGDASDSWSSRASYWHRGRGDDQTQLSSENPPLILSGHGMRLRINHGALEIQNGFTHYPQAREQWRIFPGEPERPSRIIMLDGSGAITLDVLSWLSVQDIPLVQLDFRGRVIAVIGTGSIGINPGILKLQLTAAQTPAHALKIAAWVLRQKLIGTRDVLTGVIPPSAGREEAISQIDVYIARLAKSAAESVGELLGLEGQCARLYFQAWRGIPINWKGAGRKPIPDAWRQIGPRNSRKNLNNRFARHPAQAMLNYAYAVLESLIRIEVVRVGLDQSIGYLHLSREGRPALILDLIEPLRASADEVILQFIGRQTFSPADFTLATDGTCRLHPQLARRVVAEIGDAEKVRELLEDFLKLLSLTPIATPTCKRKGRHAKNELQMKNA